MSTNGKHKFNLKQDNGSLSKSNKSKYKYIALPIQITPEQGILNT